MAVVTCAENCGSDLTCLTLMVEHWLLVFVDRIAITVGGFARNFGRIDKL